MGISGREADVKSWGESRLQNEWEMISGHVGRIRERLEAVRRRMVQGDGPGCADAQLELQQLAGRLAAFEAEEHAVGGRLEVVRDERERRQAQARPRLDAARDAYVAAVARLEARAHELAELRADADEAARRLLAMREEAGAPGPEALLPSRITIWRNADPRRGRDWLIDWRR
jgi:hypothetical protein